MSVAASSTASIVVLSDVDWETYEKLRSSDGNRNLRMTYDHGVLEIMSPSKLHERLAELLGRLVLVWTEERGIPVQSGGSTTFKQEPKRRGLEPDKCFFVENEMAVRERDEHDPAIDPAPDLAIEIDVSSSSQARMPIYANLGIREVWRWQEERLEVCLLDASGEYVTRRDSTVLPGFPISAAADVLRERRASDETTLVGGFRDHVRDM
jgi:Uma2 family endonuclease